MERSPITLRQLTLTHDRSIGLQIYEFLRSEITKTHIKPGAVLSENKLSEHFQVSRMPVREALMRLRQDGLVDVLPQRGSVVEKISVSNLRQICFIRTAIETAALRHGAKLDPKTFASVVDNLNDNIARQHALEHSENVSELFLDLDDAFHALICNLSGCPLSWNTVQSIKGQMDRIRYLSQGKVSPIEQLIAEHEQIKDLIVARNFERAALLLEHHLAEIMSTYIPIRHDNAQWFLQEEADLPA
ncbi:MAG: GntR family transcriptional regulator [Candidatus Anaerobiospirillum merdipullorum]|uniref:GntR family transcriptional regulator n=1 Tax=Candidatus Anaerobiospirillum merdipullorum TaxID=2838450 RepID=A0A9E2KP23_9GAMM|nr:GntR family transcriptional regulator [Candidatus Anaerobiospirillum merdipullorum]